MECCFLECTELGWGNCQKEAEWEIWDGLEPAYDHCTQACTAHVGYLLSGGPEINRVYPIEKSIVDKHASDCATHNMPAYPNEKCDCGVDTPGELVS